MSAAAAAAAAAERRRREEEEYMTGYTPTDLAEGWEFKILRSATRAFKNPERLREALEQESRAGWSLVEKFDNGRIRLRRPAAAKSKDATLGFDPYRSAYGTGELALALMIVSTVLGVMAVAVTIAILASHH
jgi:hypothetical protein